MTATCAYRGANPEESLVRDLIADRDRARDIAVDLQQRCDEALRLLEGAEPEFVVRVIDSAIDVLRGES